MSKYSLQIYLYQDFLFCVRTYSKIIVSELYLPHQQKTIKPMTDMGGVAGGLKYRVNNILFKVNNTRRGKEETLNGLLLVCDQLFGTLRR
jgi:hypothetical protein